MVLIANGLHVKSDAHIYCMRRKHRRLIKDDLIHARSQGSQTRAVLLLFVDSGLLYCALWVRFPESGRDSLLRNATSLTQTILVSFVAINMFGFEDGNVSDNIQTWQFANTVGFWIVNSTLIHIIVCPFHSIKR